MTDCHPCILLLIQCGLAKDCYDFVDALIVRLDKDLAACDAELVKHTQAAAGGAAGGRRGKGAVSNIIGLKPLHRISLFPDAHLRSLVVQTVEQQQRWLPFRLAHHQHFPALQARAMRLTWLLQLVAPTLLSTLLSRCTACASKSVSGI